MKLEEKYSIKDLDNAVKYALNNTITVQVAMDIKDLKKIENLIDKDLIKITEDDKLVVVETNRKDIKTIQEELNKNNIKYNSFACLENKKVEYLARDNGSLYVAASMLVVAKHHNEYFRLDSKNVMDKENLKSLIEFKNNNAIELPVPIKSEKNITNIDDFIKEITKPGVKPEDMVRMALELANKMKKPENVHKDSLKPKPPTS